MEIEVERLAPRGQRLLPDAAVVKDAAGLVPGACKGRGARSLQNSEVVTAAVSHFILADSLNLKYAKYNHIYNVHTFISQAILH